MASWLDIYLITFHAVREIVIL